MDEYYPAVGREFGKVDTDSGGLARYSFKLEVPPGIHYGMAPEVSLEYCHGTPNGSLGIGWALGGVSCIRRGPSNLAYDGINPAPLGYDSSQPKLTLDGAELLNISGEYDAADAQYVTEVDHEGKTVTPLGLGFVVRDATGRQAEYGTTDDSRVLIAAQQKIREWRLKRVIDYYGNAITYSYVASPKRDGSIPDLNSCYLYSIRYTSNVKTGYAGNRIINFDYSSRPDVVIQTAQGDKCVWASRLAAVRFGIVQEDQIKITRSYELGYTISEHSGDSCLTSIMETSHEGATKMNLLPSTFGYTVPGVARQDTFKTVPQQTTPLLSTTGNVAIFPMNITGRCLADLACIRQDRNSKQLTIKTYLAVKNKDGSVGWEQSTGAGAVANLPFIDMKNGFPSILTPDLNNDGRADFIVPHTSPDNRVQFSISQCLGTGFEHARTKKTNFPWTEGSKFMALDLVGRGPSIVQIFSDRGKLTFRNFVSVSNNGTVDLSDAITTPTSYDNTNTIDWVQLNHSGTGAKTLVRVWLQDLGQGRSQVKATAFVLSNAKTSDGKFAEKATSSLGNPVASGAAKLKYSVLACDINADGTQDMVLATAQYSNSTMALTYSIYLGDGQGSFTKHGEPITRTVPAPIPLKTPEYGDFHTTNINGSNYPTLVYVYQERNSKAFVGLSVDGRSDGLIGDVQVYPLAQNIPSSNWEVTTADLNGNSMGGWIFHTIENDAPRVIPIYNRASVTDFLSWAQNSMGLRTRVTYGCLSDADVYSSGVNWREYTNKSQDSYAVIAAPSYVVTGLEQSNVSSINAFAYKTAIKKTYARARANTRGRGWQGFAEINTLNVTDGVLTTETYIQDWPQTGAKSQIDTKSSDGTVMKSIKTLYENNFKSRGSWKIYRVNQTFEQTDMIEGGTIVRSNACEYQYDDNGNTILQSPSETQRGQIMFQSWKRCAYKTIDGITGFLTSQKHSTQKSNLDMLNFESGDVSLTKFEHKPSKAVLKDVLSWSTDVGDFVRKSYVFDDYGRVASSVDAGGLCQTKTYDSLFQTFPVIVTEEGPGVKSTVLTAFDISNGTEVAKLESNGLLLCHRADGFGRKVETRAKSTGQGLNTVQASTFFAKCPYVADSTLTDLLTTSHLDPQQEINFGRQKSPAGSVYIFEKTVNISKEGVSGQHESIDYLDCLKQARKRCYRDADNTDKVWMCWDYDSRGQHVFESFPVKVTAAIDLDWSPDRSPGVAGITSSFDTLGRVVKRVRPSHAQSGRFIVTTTSYSDGGARIQERTWTSTDASGTPSNSTQLATLERRYIHIQDDDLIIENVDDNGGRSLFQYDTSGRLTRSTDAAGQTEIRTYNSYGDIIKFDNQYQNVARTPNTPAVVCKYNAARQLVSKTNAVNEVIDYKRDAKGRPLLKTGEDGRVVKYVYDLGGIESLSSVTIFPQGIDNPFESHLEFAYDHCGRVKERKISLADGNVYITSISYDWLDRVVQKILPDNVTITHSYRGSEIVSSILSDSTASTWSLSAETMRSSPYGRPEKLRIRGTGIKEDLLHEWEYDSQGFPLSHALGTDSKAAVKEHYIYNELDQIGRRHEFVTGATTDYKYSGRRLVSSQSGSGVANTYNYDSAGNLIQKRGTNIEYSQGRAKGSGKQEFDISYDNAGRLKERLTQQSALSFAYDSLGAIKSISDSKNATSIAFLTDHEGEMLRRKHSDGSMEVFLGDSASVRINSDGSRTVQHHIFNEINQDDSGHILGTVSNTFASMESKRPLQGQRNVSLQFTDTKGNVTHTLNGDAELQDKLEYDDYGMLDADTTHLEKDAVSKTYEGKYYDTLSGLLNFKSRWYDPLVGRFTIPDNILDIGSLIRTDGLNRYAFENNDPINNTDPTGHWSWSSMTSLVISVLLITAAIAITVATGGAAAPLAAAAVGALVSAGVAGIAYSVQNHDEQDAGKFWAGFGTTIAINAAIGAVTGAATAGASGMATAFGRIGTKALISGFTSVASQAADRFVENKFYGTNHDLWEDGLKTFFKGAAVGGIFGAIGDKTPAGRLPKGDKIGTSTIPRMTGGARFKEVVKLGGKGLLKPGGKLLVFGYEELRLQPSYEHFLIQKPIGT